MAEFTRQGLTTSRFFHYGRPSSLGSKTGPDFAGLAAWLRGLKKPCALVAANDATAADVIRLCESEGLVVPRDVAVLGIDDNPVFCRHTEPNLSSLRLDGRRAGVNAARALAALMDGSPAPDPAALRFGVSVSRRASTAATPSIGEIVQRAIDFIDANACRGATLGDVVRYCGYSRTLVALRFRQMTGRSIARAIRKRRLDEARRLLRETSMGIEEIAPLCGYESASALHRAFSRETGTTMGAWRRTVAAPQNSEKSRENHPPSP
jgi:LacI family transcriptional regulator